jgi:hypothetical protein
LSFHRDVEVQPGRCDRALSYFLPRNFGLRIFIISEV